jgi:CHAT domain-containing protein
MVRTLMGGKLCAGPDAGIENFRTLAGNRSILHLAMHGVADDQQPWRSNLWFGGDEALYAFEIQHMKLNSDLAVLSACRTGTGKLQRGEGIMSLAGAFLYAGCRSVVMSLWESDDRYAGVFLEGFYEGLKNGKDKDLALRDARISFLSEAAPSAAHPRNWAGFLLIGDPGPLRSSQPATGRTGWLVLFGVLCLFGGTVFVVRSRKHNSRDREA